MHTLSESIQQRLLGAVTPQERRGRRDVQGDSHNVGIWNKG